MKNEILNGSILFQILEAVNVELGTCLRFSHADLQEKLPVLVIVHIG